MLDGVYRNSTAVFHEVAAPTLEEKRWISVTAPVLADGPFQSRLLD